MKTKPFTTIEQQVDILVKRGLIINNIDEAKFVLNRCNYYRLSGYSLTLRQNDKFYEGVSFSNIMQIYNFDSEFKSIILLALEYVEVSVKAYYSYYFSKLYNPIGYHNSKNFINDSYYNEFIEVVKSSITHNKKNEVFIKHHQEKYDGEFPIWVILELLSFGTISRIFKNSKEELKSVICKKNYGKIKHKYITNWLEGLTILRNICAHRGRLYNRSISYPLLVSTKDKVMIENFGFDLQMAIKSPFIYIYTIRKLIDDNNAWDKFVTDFKQICSKYPFVKLSYYGFPDNWEEILV